MAIFSSHYDLWAVMTPHLKTSIVWRSFVRLCECVVVAKLHTTITVNIIRFICTYLFLTARSYEALRVCDTTVSPCETNSIGLAVARWWIEPAICG